MSNKISNAIVSTFAVNDLISLDGLKTWIGVGLIAAAHSVNALNEVALMLPDLSGIDTIKVIIEQFVQYSESVLRLLGSGFLTTGIIGKAFKFARGIFG